MKKKRVRAISDSRMDFYEMEFKRISGIGEWNYEKILSVKNFKSQAVLPIDDNVVASINAILADLSKKNCLDKITELCKISGIGFATATTFLAITDSTKFAILDSRVAFALSKKQLKQYLKENFQFELEKYWAEESKGIAKRFSESKDESTKQKLGKQIYRPYMALLNQMKKSSGYNCLRDIEFKLFSEFE